MDDGGGRLLLVWPFASVLDSRGLKCSLYALCIRVVFVLVVVGVTAHFAKVLLLILAAFCKLDNCPFFLPLILFSEFKIRTRFTTVAKFAAVVFVLIEDLIRLITFPAFRVRIGEGAKVIDLFRYLSLTLCFYFLTIQQFMLNAAYVLL